MKKPSDLLWTMEELAAMSAEDLAQLRAEYGDGLRPGVNTVRISRSREVGPRPRTWSERPSPTQPDGSLILGLPEPEPWMTQEELDALPSRTEEQKARAAALYAELMKEL